MLALVVFAASIACGIVVLESLPLYAAIQIEYFDAVTIDDYLRLEWRTAVENDLALIEVYCKEEDEPNSAYHLIGSRIAQGNNDAGADYAMNLYSGIEPNETYCFRLKEITTDGRKGDLLDYCGYGLNITPFDEIQIVEVTAEPTPLLVPLITSTIDSSLPPTITVLITPTTAPTAPVTVIVTTTATPTPPVMEDEAITIINTPGREATATDVATVSTTVTATLTPLPTVGDATEPGDGSSDNEIIVVVPTETATPDQANQATPTALPTPEPAITITATNSVTPAITFTPTITVIPLLTATEAPVSALSSSAQNSPLPSPTASRTVTDQSALSSQTTPPSTMSTAIGDTSSSSSGALANEEISDEQTETASTETDINSIQDVVESPPYIILTATPVETPLGLEPTFTPFPTAVPQPDANFVTATLPSQNLMMLLLCGIFSGASGLGILGLVTTLLYMRSRSGEQQGK